MLLLRRRIGDGIGIEQPTCICHAATTHDGCRVLDITAAEGGTDLEEVRAMNAGHSANYCKLSMH